MKFMKDILKQSYNKSASGYDEKFRNLQTGKYSALLENHLHAIKDAEKMLDLGCGTGLLAEYLSSKGLSVEKMTGVDFSEEMLCFAKKRLIDCFNSDISNLPFAENTFDVIFSFTVFRIIETDINEEDCIFKKISKILKPDGFFFISILAEKIDDIWYTILRKNGFITEKELLCGQDHGFVLKNRKCNYR